MSWRDDLRPASFRGVAFSVTASDSEFGRRTAQHEYPLRDTPYAEDLGRKQRQYSVDAYVFGEDYLAKRDALIDACEQPGPGQFVHPYYGTKQVSCTACRVSEGTNDGRMARLSLTFMEAGERVFPAASSDFLSRLGVAGDGVFSSTGGWFERVFSVARLPQTYIDRAVSQVQALGTHLEGIRGIAETATGFYRTAHQLVTEAVNLVAAPAALASGIMGAVGAISDLRFDWGSISNAYASLAGLGGSIADMTAYTPTDSAGRVEVARPLFGFGDPSTGDAAFSPTPTGAPATSTRAKEQKNTAAITALVRTAAVVVAVQAAGEKKYKTYQNALAERDELCEEIDLLSEEIDDDEVFQALQELRAVLTQAIPNPGEDLPDLVTIRNNVTRPSLVIAYDLYESMSREADLVARNRVEHPGFVPAGVDLEVIRG